MNLFSVRNLLAVHASALHSRDGPQERGYSGHSFNPQAVD